MTSRFDNLSTEELARRHIEALAEHIAIRDALCARLKSECPVEVGKVYLIGPGRRFAGRKMKVTGIVPSAPHVFGLRSSPSVGDCFALAEGRLDGRSKAGDGFTLKHQQVRADRLEEIG